VTRTPERRLDVYGILENVGDGVRDTEATADAVESVEWIECGRETCRLLFALRRGIQRNAISPAAC
jgi:hypothetical protein